MPVPFVPASPGVATCTLQTENLKLARIEFSLADIVDARVPQSSILSTIVLCPRLTQRIAFHTPKTTSSIAVGRGATGVGGDVIRMHQCHRVLQVQNAKHYKQKEHTTERGACGLNGENKNKPERTAMSVEGHPKA